MLALVLVLTPILIALTAEPLRRDLTESDTKVPVEESALREFFDKQVRRAHDVEKLLMWANAHPEAPYTAKVFEHLKKVSECRTVAKILENATDPKSTTAFVGVRDWSAEFKGRIFDSLRQSLARCVEISSGNERLTESQLDVVVNYAAANAGTDSAKQVLRALSKAVRSAFACPEIPGAVFTVLNVTALNAGLELAALEDKVRGCIGTDLTSFVREKKLIRAFKWAALGPGRLDKFHGKLEETRMHPEMVNCNYCSQIQFAALQCKASLQALEGALSAKSELVKTSEVTQKLFNYADSCVNKINISEYSSVLSSMGGVTLSPKANDAMNKLIRSLTAKLKTDEELKPLDVALLISSGAPMEGPFKELFQTAIDRFIKLINDENPTKEKLGNIETAVFKQRPKSQDDAKMRQMRSVFVHRIQTIGEGLKSEGDRLVLALTWPQVRPQLVNDKSEQNQRALASKIEKKLGEVSGFYMRELDEYLVEQLDEAQRNERDLFPFDTPETLLTVEEIDKLRKLIGVAQKTQI